MKNPTWLIVLFALSAFVTSGTAAHATTVTRDIDFHAQFGEPAKPLIEDIIDMGLGNRLGAVAHFQPAHSELYYTGSFGCDYTPFMSDVGTTSITASFDPIGGTISSEIGFYAHIGFYLAIEKVYVGKSWDYYYTIDNVLDGFGVESSAESDWKLPTVLGVSKWGVSLGGTFAGTAWVKYTPEHVYSQVMYGPSGCDLGDCEVIDFTIVDNTELQLNLDQPGVWDVYVVPFWLQGAGSIWVDVQCVIEGSWLYLPAVELYRSDPMEIHPPPSPLPFHEDSVDMLQFSITVGDGGMTVIPEPSTIALLGIGIAGVVGLMRRRLRG